MKVAFLGNYSIQFLVKLFKTRNPDYSIYEGLYNSVDTEILNPLSDIYSFKPDILVIHESYFTIQDHFYSTDNNGLKATQFYEEKTTRIIHLIEFIKSKIPHIKIIYPLLLEYDDSVFGTHSLKSPKSLLYQVRMYNNEIIRYSQSNDYLLPINPLNYKDNNLANRNNLYFNADLHFTTEYLEVLSNRITQIINSIKGLITKCVVLDLDNTLWGGIVGEDGPLHIKIGDSGEGKYYKKLQLWLKQLKNRGIILAVCSKNDEEMAKEPFLKNPNMILQLADFSIFVANWENKADNIRLIKESLNIGYDSILFLDDNPAEREIVRQLIPEVVVPELPKDLTDSLDFLIQKNLFENRYFSENDKDRTLQYRAEFNRLKTKLNYNSIDEYLKSLGMIGIVRDFNPEDSDRISQLTLRSNQFNLRTIRYSKEEILDLITKPDYLTFTLKLSDKFGDHGLVGIAIIKLLNNQEAFLDSFLMSCRVLKRGAEDFLLNHLLFSLKSLKIRSLKGQFIRTKKNKLVNDFFENHQFRLEEKSESSYCLEVAKYKMIKNYITNENE